MACNAMLQKQARSLTCCNGCEQEKAVTSWLRCATHCSACSLTPDKHGAWCTAGLAMQGRAPDAGQPLASRAWAAGAAAPMHQFAGRPHLHPAWVAPVSSSTTSCNEWQPSPSSSVVSPVSWYVTMRLLVRSAAAADSRALTQVADRCDWHKGLTGVTWGRPQVACQAST